MNGHLFKGCLYWPYHKIGLCEHSAEKLRLKHYGTGLIIIHYLESNVALKKLIKENNLTA